MRRLILLSLVVVALALAACAAPAAAPAAPVAEAPAAEAPAADASAATTDTAAAEAPAAEGAMASLPEVDPLTVTGNIVTAGSSTVYPLSEAVTELFIDEGYAGQITIDSIGTGAGFERFCVAGETDISNASRPIRDTEIASCAAINRTPIEFRVGTDALAIVVHPDNDWIPAEGLTIEQLAMVFSDQTTNWSDIDAAWPAQPIQRFSPGTDSGTYDYFVEAVMDEVFAEPEGAGEEALLRSANLQLSEDDNVLVQGVEGNPYAIGYFGFAYFSENADRLRDIAVNGVTPEVATVNDGTYPLARPLFIYSDASIIQGKPQVASFINFYLTRVNEVVRRVGYFEAPPEEIEAGKAALTAAMGQ
ncbi:MAG: PstS family phosphate ABC transporter substrate-binding protein [Caldilineaceae bacterium]